MLIQNINLQNPEEPRRDEESIQDEESSSEEFQEGVHSQPFLLYLFVGFLFILDW